MKQLICCLLLFLSAATARACDACGCSAGSQSLGILPQFYRHFVGLQYQYRSFSSLHQEIGDNKPVTKGDESYNTYQLWGRYYVGKRLQLYGFVPYRTSLVHEDGNTIQNSGLGDVSVWANYIFIKTPDSSESQWNQVLLAGGGIKAPTGHHDGISILDREGLPNVQPGTGSWDFVTDVNYTVRRNSIGLNAEAAYTFTTVDKENYKYGNKLLSGLTGFYWLQTGKFALLPQLGLRYEFTLHDYDNYRRKWLNDQTGGNIFYAMAGVQAYYSHWGLQLSYQLPITQNYAAGNVTAKQAATAGLFFLF